MFAHHDLDPRSKLAFVLVVSGLAIAMAGFEPLTLLAAAVIMLVAAGRGLRVRSWLGFLSTLKVLVPAIFLLNLLFYAGGTVLWQLPVVPLSITLGGLKTSFLIILRLLVIAGVAAWFAQTTDAEAFEAALVRLHVPWPLAFVFSLTLRLLPEMSARFRMVEDAQLSRGLTLEGGPIRQARARIPMLLPFFVAIIEYGYELSDALVVREFGRSKHRTSLVSLAYHRADYVLYGVSAILLVGVPIGFRVW